MAVRQPVFKPYYRQQIMAIPPTLAELIPKSYPVRVVNDVINKQNQIIITGFECLSQRYTDKLINDLYPPSLITDN